MSINPRTCVFSVLVAFIGQLAGPAANAIGDPQAHLAQNVAVDSPAQGESVPLDSVAGFNSAGGTAIFDPGNSFVEEFTYTGIDPEQNTLIGLDRPNPKSHPYGSIVQPTSSAAPTTAPSESPNSEATGAPAVVPPQGAVPDELGSTPDPMGALSTVAPLASEQPSAESTDSDVVCELEIALLGACGLPIVSIPCDPGSACSEILSTLYDACGTETTTQCVEKIANDPLSSCGPGTACWDVLTLLNQACGSDYLTQCVEKTIGEVGPLPEVVALVQFDDVVGLPTSFQPGCGYAGFTAYTAPGRPTTQPLAYTATATTEATLSAPHTYQGNLDGSGRAVLYYCPPPGILTNPPFEVTFTATVQESTGTAVRTWKTVDGVWNTAPTADADVAYEDVEPSLLEAGLQVGPCVISGHLKGQGETNDGIVSGSWDLWADIDCGDVLMRGLYVAAEAVHEGVKTYAADPDYCDTESSYTCSQVYSGDIIFCDVCNGSWHMAGEFTMVKRQGHWHEESAVKGCVIDPSNDKYMICHLRSRSITVP